MSQEAGQRAVIAVPWVSRRITATAATAMATAKGTRGERRPSSRPAAVNAPAAANGGPALPRPATPAARRRGGPSPGAAAGGSGRGRGRGRAVAASPRTPVARSPRMSGRTLARCAPQPSSAAGENGPPGRPRVARQPQGHERRQRAEPHRVGQPGQHVRLQPEVVGPGRGDAGEMDGARPPGLRRARAARRAPGRRSRRPTPSGRSPRRPRRACRVRPAAVSRPASTASLHQPTES